MGPHLYISCLPQVDVSEVTQMVAQDSEKKGLHEDAIKLYDLAKASILISHCDKCKSYLLNNFLSTQVFYYILYRYTFISIKCYKFLFYLADTYFPLLTEP